MLQMLACRLDEKTPPGVLLTRRRQRGLYNMCHAQWKEGVVKPFWAEDCCPSILSHFTADCKGESS